MWHAVRTCLRTFHASLQLQSCQCVPQNWASVSLALLQEVTAQKTVDHLHVLSICLKPVCLYDTNDVIMPKAVLTNGSQLQCELNK